MRSSQIILCSGIHLDAEHTNVLNYTENEMLTLCQTNALYNKNDYSFIRDRGTIQTDCAYGTALQCNYMAFQNKDYSNKWFFAFIDDVKYLGEDNTEIVYTVDSFATFFPSLTLNDCYVVREHVNDDTIGKNTLPEDLDVGTLISDRTSAENKITGSNHYWLVIATNYNPGDVDDDDDPGTMYAGIGVHGGYIQGCQWFAWQMTFDFTGTDTSNNFTYINKFILKTGKKHPDSIQSIFALPDKLFDSSDIETNHLVKNKGYTYGQNGGRIYTTDYISRSTWFHSFSDYTAKNNKLYCWPYSFLRITNHAGNYNDYKIEDFGILNSDYPDNIYFGYEAIACENCSASIYPMSYQGQTSDRDNSITLGKYPTFSWSSDSFTNWLTQNGINTAVNTASSAISSGISIGVGIWTGSGMAISNGLLSVASTVANTFGTIRNASFMSNTASGNVNAGDNNFISNLLTYKFIRMRCKKEYLEKIDSYFSRFRI